MGKLRYPRVLIRDPVLTDVVSILSKRAKRLGKDSHHAHFRQLRAELTRQAIGQPSRVVHRDDDRTRPRSIDDARHELSHAGHLRDRKDEMCIGKIQREKRQRRIHDRREVRGGPPGLYNPSRGCKTSNVPQDTFPVVPLVKDKDPQSGGSTDLPTQRFEDLLQQVIDTPALPHLLIVDGDAIVVRRKAYDLGVGGRRQALRHQLALLLTTGLDDDDVRADFGQALKDVGPDNGGTDDLNT
jgi:hypothetical protein